jgi:hypothetical protein
MPNTAKRKPVPSVRARDSRRTPIPLADGGDSVAEERSPDRTSAGLRPCLGADAMGFSPLPALIAWALHWGRHFHIIVPIAFNDI